jgi:hypothetical protein
MKVYELFENFDAEDVYDYAVKQGYRKQTGTKTVDGKKFPVIVLKKNADFEEFVLQFKYIINPETQAWTFVVSRGDEDGIEMASGEDAETLITHLKKKKKVSAHNLQKYFTQD